MKISGSLIALWATPSARFARSSPGAGERGLKKIFLDQHLPRAVDKFLLAL